MKFWEGMIGLQMTLYDAVPWQDEDVIRRDAAGNRNELRNVDRQEGEVERTR